MPTISVRIDKLACTGLQSVKETSNTPTEVAKTLLGKNWIWLSDEQKLELSVIGLSVKISDALKEDRRKIEIENTRRKTEEEAKQKEAKRAEEALKRNEDVKARDRVRSSPYGREERKILFKKLLDIHSWLAKEISCDCNIEVIKERGKALMLFDCIVRTMGISNTEVWELTKGKVKDFLRNKQLEIQRQKELEARKEETREFWDNVHKAMNCENVTCREGRYPHPYGHCAFKWFGRHSREEAMKQAEAWGESNRQAVVRRRELMDTVLKLAVDHGYERAVADLNSITLLASDGLMKPLSDFSLQDVSDWAEKSNNCVKGWERRRTWFDTAQEMMTTQGIDTVGRLNSESIQTLGALARDVWKSEDNDDHSNQGD